MNPLNATPDPRTLATRLGSQAAQNSTPQSRLLAIIRDLHDRNEGRRQIQDKIKATHFAMAD